MDLSDQKKLILIHVGAANGCKATELAAVSEIAMNVEDLPMVIEEMVKEGMLVEFEYELSHVPNRLKSFLLAGQGEEKVQPGAKVRDFRQRSELKQELLIDPKRKREMEENYGEDSPTSVYVRAKNPETNKWESVDLYALDHKSLFAWLLRGGNNQLAEDVVGILLGHGHRRPRRKDGIGRDR